VYFIFSSFFVFALAERKNDIESGSTMLPQAETGAQSNQVTPNHDEESRIM